MSTVHKIGLIGAGNISAAYLTLAPLFPGTKIVAVADIAPEAAKARADAFGVRAATVDELLKDDEIDTVINLTIPSAHYAVSHAILSAGKHAYSEKPFALSVEDGKKLVAEADARGLKLGSAPDTFLGGGGQTARRLIDEGRIGRIISGTTHVMSRGMEHWHPNPAFFFEPGAGPVLDLGPYYIAQLVNLVGPVKSVAALASIGYAERLVTAEGPMKGRTVPVSTPTTINAVLEFLSGAQITLGASWDVWKHGHVNPIELYGSEGTMLVPDPNFFGGDLQVSAHGGDFATVPTADAPFGKANWHDGRHANYRMLGVADLLDAADTGREPRCSGRVALHALDVMVSILEAAADRRVVTVSTTTERPALLTAEDAARLTAPR
ncbi:Gfo/Idh/MocA family protein [Prosthecomicrobium pneumaticum]|uniref:Putative dehydrogenase n=1 Tax=Prosthecomicrobium pneumaticum TaxID=81895 RepID=A0A7W9CTT2_9HYPH|nr:Gfo/Idh/MocA family oxidoreductase [Prosthecomicrobium pneumaticum]MBB5751747.1 putative dehydrogenase [Prosthecomicrobium pneumaticum]